jgi:nucleoside diphosphate kinase
MSSTLNLQRSLGIIKPHAVRHRFAILRRIQMDGIHILQVVKILFFVPIKLIEFFPCGASVRNAV